MSVQGPETTGEEQGDTNSWLEWLVGRAVNLTSERRQEVVDEFFPRGRRFAPTYTASPYCNPSHSAVHKAQALCTASHQPSALSNQQEQKANS